MPEAKKRKSAKNQSFLPGKGKKKYPDPTFFPGHAATIYLRLNDQESTIGVFGILHPTVLERFELRYPVSTLEVNIEAFL